LRKIDLIVLHHSGGTPTASKSDITGEQRFKVIKKEQHARAVVAGWGENYVMDYHFVVGQTGKIFTGQPIENPSWHATNYQVNLASIGICLLGDFEKTTPPKAQVDALIDLMIDLIKKYKIPIKNIKKHKDIVNTDCPGKYFPFGKIIEEVKSEMSLEDDYQKEKEDAKITMQRLKIITDFNQKEVNIERLAVILNRLLKSTGKF